MKKVYLKYSFEKILTIIDFKKSKEVDLKMNIKGAECQHELDYIEYFESKKRNKDFENLIQIFMDKYAITNSENLIICKSCFAELKLSKYIIESEYDNVNLKWIIRKVINNVRVEDMVEFKELGKTIYYVNLIIERIGRIYNIIELFGEDNEHKFYRNDLLVKVFKIFTAHTKYLQKYIIIGEKEAVETIYDKKKYNQQIISTYLFSFKLDQYIFSKENPKNDVYKERKGNNFIAYIVLIIILEITRDNILNLVINV